MYANTIVIRLPYFGQLVHITSTADIGVIEDLDVGNDRPGQLPKDKSKALRATEIAMKAHRG